MQNLRIEAVTPVHNRRDLTLDCLRSLLRADKVGLDLHIIIVDDGSTDGTSEAIRREFPDVEIVQGDRNLWYTAGMNRGIEAAMAHNPDYVLAINNDSSFDQGFLQYMVETAESNHRSVVGAILLEWDAPEHLFQVSPKWNLRWGGMRHWMKQTVEMLPEKPWKVELIVGNCVLYPSQAILEAGFMDEKRLPQYGDAEYTPRMRKMGWTLVIDPRAKVFCKPNDVPKSLRSLSIQELVHSLFINPHHPHSLKRRWYMIMGSAPNRFQGFTAFVVFFVRFLLGMNVEGKWAIRQNEKPLSEIFRNETLPGKQPRRSN